MESHAVLASRPLLIPQRHVIADALVCVMGAALIAVSAQIVLPLGFTPVPITGQSFAILALSSALGTRRALATVGLYLAIGIVGLPVFAQGHSGWASVVGPSGGYLLGFLVAAYVTGRFAEMKWDRKLLPSIGAMLIGNVTVYLVGLPWLALSLGTDLASTLKLGLYPFVLGDVIKLCCAGGLSVGLWRILGRKAP